MVNTRSRNLLLRPHIQGAVMVDAGKCKNIERNEQDFFSLKYPANAYDPLYNHPDYCF